MKTMRNEYRDLKKENDLIFSTLAEYDRDTITEIISVVDNTRGIGYEIELIRKDLIAMAAQAEARRDPQPGPGRVVVEPGAGRDRDLLQQRIGRAIHHDRAGDTEAIDELPQQQPGPPPGVTR